jgi:hypothetical protein
MSRASKAFTLLSGVVATGAGTAQDTGKFTRFTAQIIATSVTTGGTMAIQGSLDGTNWGNISSTAVSANGSTMVNFEGAYPQVRGNLTARTDGTYTVLLTAASN